MDSRAVPTVGSHYLATRRTSADTPVAEAPTSRPSDHPGRWIGGALGALASLALLPFALVVGAQPSAVELGSLGAIGLLGAPVGFVLGREAFPRPGSAVGARHLGWGWRSALSRRPSASS